MLSRQCRVSDEMQYKWSSVKIDGWEFDFCFSNIFTAQFLVKEIYSAKEWQTKRKIPFEQNDRCVEQDAYKY